MNNKKLENKITIMKALGHPTRLRIVDNINLLGSCSVGFLVKTLNLTQSNTSQHLSRLKNAGIVKIQRHGNENLYRINEDMKEYIQFIVSDI